MYWEWTEEGMREERCPRCGEIVKAYELVDVDDGELQPCLECRYEMFVEKMGQKEA